MKRYIMEAILVLLVAVVAAAIGCSSSESSDDASDGQGDEQDQNQEDKTPLTFGDASWSKAPINPPGADGTGGSDGDAGDGDTGDVVDGDDPGWPDGDVADGDTEDGDVYDGDTTDGDFPDGDTDAEACPEIEECEAPSMCIEEDTQVMSVCSYVEDPDHPGCVMPQIEEVVCPEGTECQEPDGDAECFPIGEESKRLRALECPDTQEPLVLYMSNDDSNSQASPILCRSIIHEGGVVFPPKVRIHEFLNYYDLSYDNPSAVPAKVGMQMRRTDADIGEFTLLLFAQGRHVAAAERRPLNLTFSLDTSGSMSGFGIEMTRAVLREVAHVLDEGDVISIVEWSNHQSVLLESHQIQGPDDETLLRIVNNLDTGGSTDLHSGLVKAYELARANFREDRINRVFLISDGGANTGITDINLIAREADDSNGEGIYMIGVGASESASYYNDELMDDVTDAGKGAYLFIDSAEEAARMFGNPERFLANVDVAARDVQMELTLPWYFAMKEFHGEEYSENPEEVEPQHLAPNDAMSYHQIIQACDPEQVMAEDTIKAKATYTDPLLRMSLSDELELSMGDIVQADATQLRKGDVVVSYAKALIVIGAIWMAGESEGAIETAEGMAGWLREAATELDDTEIDEIAELMEVYAISLKNGPYGYGYDYGYYSMP